MNTMKTEFEAKFTSIDIQKMRSTLLANGAVCEKPMRLMRRVTIDSPEMKQRNGFLRVRDEGDRTTITYKQFDALSVDGAKEHEVIVDSFEEAVALLGAAGLPYQSFQESKRETWSFDGVEIVIDEWPWLRPYIEIEAGSEDRVRDMALRLGFDWSNAIFGDVMAAYRVEYPHLGMNDTVGNIAQVRFGDDLPELLRQ